MSKGCLLAVFLGLLTLSLTQDPNCIKSDPKQGCLLCTPDFFVWQGVCAPIPIGCDIFDRTRARCIYCKDGYSLTDGVCQGGNQQNTRQTLSSNAQLGGVAVAMGGSSSTSSGSTSFIPAGQTVAPAGTISVSGSDIGSWQSMSSANMGGQPQSRTSTTTVTTSSSGQSSSAGAISNPRPISEIQRTESRQVISVVGGPVESVLDRALGQAARSSTVSQTQTRATTGGSSAAQQSFQSQSSRTPRFEYSTVSDSSLGTTDISGATNFGNINTWQPIATSTLTSSGGSSQQAQQAQTVRISSLSVAPQQTATFQSAVSSQTANNNVQTGTLSPTTVQPVSADTNRFVTLTSNQVGQQANQFVGATQSGQTQLSGQRGQFNQFRQSNQVVQTTQVGPSTVTTVTQTTPQFAIGPVPNTISSTVNVAPSGPVGGPTQTQFAWNQPAIDSEKTYSDANCRKYTSDQKGCLECSNRFYLNKATNLCSMVNPQCQAYDKDSGSCTSCYKGYVLYQGQCYIPAGGQAEIDNNCKVPSPDGNCQECYRGFVVLNGKCRVVNNLCRTYDSVGACLSCYSGYVLASGKCTVATDADMGTDPNCRNFKDGQCVQCSGGFFLKDNLCRQVSPQCRTFNAQTGACTTCYAGYSLKGPECVPATSQTIETNCKVYVNNECTECAKGFILRGSNCIQVSTLCRTFNESTGFCTSCYSGYTLQDGACLVNKQAGVDTSNCRKWENNRCVQCSERFYFDQNGVCVAVSDLCASYDNSGACTQCYPGYYVSGRTCLKADPAQLDPNCRNFKDGQCVQCSGGYILRNGRCLQVSPLCRTFNNQTGACTTCYAGYMLSNGNCIRSESSDGQSNCKRFENGECIQCANRYIRKGGSCVQVSDLCATYDNVSGDCLTCYKGYGLMNGICAKILLVTDPPPQATFQGTIDSSRAQALGVQTAASTRSDQLFGQAGGQASQTASSFGFRSNQASQISGPASQKVVTTRTEVFRQQPAQVSGQQMGATQTMSRTQGNLQGGSLSSQGSLQSFQIGVNPSNSWQQSTDTGASGSSSGSSNQGGTVITRTQRTVTTLSQQATPSIDLTSQLLPANTQSIGGSSWSSQLRSSSSGPASSSWSMP